MERSLLRRHLLAVFVASGFAGLIYQSIWSHYLGLFLGHAAYAQAIVLAIFMGGMAIGAGWVARAGVQWRNLIRTYALIEAAIGVLGIAFHWVYSTTVGVSYDHMLPALGEPWLISAYRWSIASLLILPQTILLGMTFPLMSGGLIRRFPGSEGHLLGGLYFTNSIGAALGALIAVFVLLPRLGLHGSLIVAGVLNLLVAAVAGWLAREDEPLPSVPPATGPAAVSAGPTDSTTLRAVLLATALSGAASFVYEIVWIRMLGMAVGSTLHAFELMLASFIAGLAFGGLWIRNRADRSADPVRLVAWMQIAMGLAALGSLVLYADAFEWVGWMLRSLARSEGGYALFNGGTALIAIAIMLPAAFFAGTTLPIFTLILLRRGFGERSIGRVYAWNTLGSIVGVFAAIHLLIPALGLKLALCLAALVDMAIGLILLRRRVDSRPAMLQFAGAGLVAAIALGLCLTKVQFDPMRLSAGVFRWGKVELPKDQRVVFYQDGKTASVSVISAPDGTLRVATNGKVDASITMASDVPPSEDEPTMALLGALPLAHHPRPETVGVIGFGSGMTTHTLLADERLRRVDTIEIEPAMVQGARAFGDRVRRAYDDPRSHVVIDDAKAYFSGQNARYDIIVSEPSNPWVNGVGSLFSKEFYEFIPRHLEQDGLFVQWVQLYEIDDALVSSILNALTPAFSDYSAWLANDADLIIIGTPSGKLPEADYTRVLQGALGKELARQGFTRPEHFMFRKVADARLLRALGRLYGSRANSDYHPVLSLQAPLTRFLRANARMLAGLPTRGQAILQALGIRDASSNDADGPDPGHFPALQLTANARNLAAAMTSESTLGPDVDPARTATVRALAAELGRCGKPWPAARVRYVLDTLQGLAGNTLAWLPSRDLEAAWTRPAWNQCGDLPPQVAAYLELTAARAAGDLARVESLGRALAVAEPGDDDASSWRPVREAAFHAVFLAQAAQGKWPELVAWEAEHGKDLGGTGPAMEWVSLLLTLADEPQPTH